MHMSIFILAHLFTLSASASAKHVKLAGIMTYHIMSPAPKMHRQTEQKSKSAECRCRPDQQRALGPHALHLFHCAPALHSFGYAPQLRLQSAACSYASRQNMQRYGHVHRQRQRQRQRPKAEAEARQRQSKGKGKGKGRGKGKGKGKSKMPTAGRLTSAAAMCSAVRWS